MQYYKYHALGNDYIVIDPQNFKIKLTNENIKLICHRNFGIGSDEYSRWTCLCSWDYQPAHL